MIRFIAQANPQVPGHRAIGLPVSRTSRTALPGNPDRTSCASLPSPSSLKAMCPRDEGKPTCGSPGATVRLDLPVRPSHKLRACAAISRSLASSPRWIVTLIPGSRPGTAEPWVGKEGGPMDLAQMEGPAARAARLMQAADR